MKKLGTFSAASILIAGLLAGGAVLAHDSRGGDRARGFDFEAADTNSDGMLARSEIAGAVSAHHAGMDVNGDGALDRDEIVSVMRARGGWMSDRAERRADRMMERFGAGDGEPVEITTLTDRHVTRILEHVDTDEDDAISRTEFDAAHENWREHGRGDRHHGRHHRH